MFIFKHTQIDCTFGNRPHFPWSIITYLIKEKQTRTIQRNERLVLTYCHGNMFARMNGSTRSKCRYSCFIRMKNHIVEFEKLFFCWISLTNLQDLHALEILLLMLMLIDERHLQKIDLNMDYFLYQLENPNPIYG